MTEDIRFDDTINRPNPRPELSASPVDKRPMLIGIGVAVLMLLIFGGFGVYLFLHPEQAAVLRDIFIIYLGLGAFFVILFLIALVVITTYLVLKINDLIKMLDREIKPVLTKLQESAVTVQGTATFLSDHAVKPVIQTASTISAAQTVVRTLFRRD
jgi:hypothetical protein